VPPPLLQHLRPLQPRLLLSPILAPPSGKRAGTPPHCIRGGDEWSLLNISGYDHVAYSSGVLSE